jgi:hypothetical protein
VAGIVTSCTGPLIVAAASAVEWIGEAAATRAVTMPLGSLPLARLLATLGRMSEAMKSM